LFLINRYELDDPVDDNSLGDFENSDLLQLYHDLVGLGDDNLTAALIVGATIEDLDIHDIEDMMARTDNEDILLVYELLQKGSRNHLRSFISQLELIAPDYTYTPQYISQDAYDAIIDSSMETGQ
jgi:hypothetical protein